MNKLTLNLEKTCYLPFTSYTSGLPNLGTLNIGLDSPIQEADKIKYLGIIIDRNLRWDMQIKHTARKIRGFLSKFKYLRDFLSQNHLKTLYFSLIESLLSYGILGWGGVNDCFLNELHILQKWILKIMYHKKLSFPTEALYNESQIKDIRQIYFQKILLFVHLGKIKLSTHEHCYNTRRNDSIFHPRSNKTIGQRTARYLAPRIYSLLPLEIKNIKQHSTFKRELKKWIITKRHIFINLINQRLA